MLFSFTFGIDKDVIKVYYHENIELVCQNLIDIALKSGYCISQSTRHYLILEMAIVGPKDYLLFIVFSDPHLMVNIGKIELGEMSSPT